MAPEANDLEEIHSKLGVHSIIGMACLVLGAIDLLAWAELTPPAWGWLTRISGADWLQPLAGLAIVVVGVILAGPDFLQAFSGRDEERKKARRAALLAAAVAGAALVLTLEMLVPARNMHAFASSTPLAKGARQGGLIGLLLFAGAFATFIIMRARDVGFWTVSIPLVRSNEVWRLSIKAEISFRALRRNEEVYHLVEQRAGFVEAQVGAKFDELCKHLIKESADLSTIDSTARLQMDVGHVFKRYADFHVRLAETRHRLFDDIMQVTNDAVVDLLEKKLPGLHVRTGADQTVKVAISFPILDDTETLRQRRAEWDETLRSIVSVGAAKGNQIVGDWIERASRGEVSANEIPIIAQMLGAPNAGSGLKEIAARSGMAPLDFSRTAKELHDWIGRDQNIGAPGVEARVREFFSKRKLLLGEGQSPEISAEQLLELIRQEFGGALTLRTIAAALARRWG